MALKIIGTGFGRTGTLSLKVALEQLGFGPCHHMKEVMLNREQAEWFSQASKGIEVDWIDVFRNYKSAVDWPAVAYYKNIANTFPEAKIILGIRDPNSWYKSVSETIYNVVPSFPMWIRFIFPRSDKVLRMIEKTIWQGEFSGRFEDKDFAIKVFNEHIKSVKEAFPVERILIHSPKDGWQPLCDFLGVEIPDTPYPWENDSSRIKQAILLMKLLRWLPAIVLAVIIGLTL